MKRAHEGQAEGTAPGAAAVKKPKIDVAALKAKLQSTKAKLGALKASSVADTSTAAEVPPPSHSASTGPALAPPSVPPPASLPAHHPLAPPLSAPPGVAGLSAPPSNAEPEPDAYFDPRMARGSGRASRGRRRGALNFLDRDKALERAEAQKLKLSHLGGDIRRAQVERERAQQALRDSEAAAGGGDANLVPLGARAQPSVAPEKDEIPDIEWWDALVLDQANYDAGDDGTVRLKDAKIGNLVEHPVPIEPPAERAAPAPQPLKLTKKEMRKMRRQRREAREKEKQLLVQQGLLEPAKNKVKLSNMHRVYGADGVLDATAIEMEIRKAAAERQAAHEDRNAARKLTTSERKEKKLKKLFDDDDIAEVHVQVFKLNKLSDKRHLYKVDINAKENHLTGACITTEAGINVVIVEGCAKGIRRFNRLMLVRIDWNPTLGIDDGDEDMFEELNKCYLVWQGTQPAGTFDEFVREKCSTETAARQFLASKGAAHLWDAAKHFVPPAGL